MFRHVSRSLIVALFLLSLLTWFYVPFLLAWELSVVTTQLGHWLALITIVVSVPLLISPKRSRSDVVFAALAFVAFSTFLAPLAGALKQFPGEISFMRLFGAAEKPTPFQRTTFLAADGKTPLNIDFYPPTQPQPTAVAPWVLVIHGGGWINGTSDQLPELNWLLNKKGYAVVSIDYRLSPASLWPAPKDDAFKALTYIRDHASEWKIDPNRWAILGRSAGAQIAGVVAYSLHGEQKPKGFISFYGPSDLVFGYNLGQENDILHSRSLLRGFLGGTPDQAMSLYKSASEMETVSADACPTLIIHGEKDMIVSYLHSVRLFELLKIQNIEEQFVSLSFGPHGFDFFFNGPEGQASTSAVQNFLAKVLPLAP